VQKIVLHSAQTGSGADTASCTMDVGGGGVFLGEKRLGRDADHPPDVKNGGAIRAAFICLHGMVRN
jgi:hypothetical protein